MCLSPIYYYSTERRRQGRPLQQPRAPDILEGYLLFLTPYAHQAGSARNLTEFVYSTSRAPEEEEQLKCCSSVFALLCPRTFKPYVQEYYKGGGRDTSVKWRSRP